ncbi:putative ABC transport system ATP-binding protein [Microbacterium telephonicum]|uniref:Putative ABC transport system ATP-binding protein n=1 Tax=Microbacterium telephonicum TaxID=1714841 RepID=A0A498C269_9MICO|nr:ATP-binding cassette domain-containing protein [Microbacterium telephonicum]RLK49333.1 putative ABC transport system ATP-binding protein [Microbacterium telephonicum]
MLLEARNVSFGYQADRPVVEGWSAQFRSGSMTALRGPSGRGKSTLLYLLGLMLRPTAGDVMVEGRVVTGLSDSHRARLRASTFGFVFQDASLDQSRTVLENVTETALYAGVPRKSARQRAQLLLDRIGVDVPAHRKPGQVSGGQAQRIALARALQNSPRVLLADEPTGNLDPATASLVVETLRQHAYEGAAVIVVTHSPEVARSCDTEIRL